MNKGTTPGSFLEWRRIERLDEIDQGMVVVHGVPSDFTGDCHGQRYGPKAIREASGHIYRMYVDEPGEVGVVDPYDGRVIRLIQSDNLVDLGDVDAFAPNLQGLFDAVYERASAIYEAGAFGVALGGDHYTSYPSAKAFHDANPGKKIGYIQFDAHPDLIDENPAWGKHWYGTNARRVSEFERVDPKNMVWVGPSEPMLGEEWEFMTTHGCRCISGIEATRMGGARAAEEALEIASDGTDIVYVTLDIDCVNTSDAPGTVNGITFRGLSAPDFLDATRALGEHSDVIGGVDLVEVVPALDPHLTTAGLAVQALIEVLGPRVDAAHSSASPVAASTDGAGSAGG